MRDDPWSAGPFRATPIAPSVIPEFGSAREQVPRELAPLTAALGDFGLMLARAVSDPRAAELARLLASPPYAIVFAQEINRGFLVGALRSMEEWTGDLQEMIQRYTGETIALAMVLGEEVMRALTEENPKGLSRETLLVIQTSELAAPLKLLGMLTTKNNLEKFLDEVGLLASELVNACTLAGQEWIDALLAENGNPARQGYLVGELYGTVVVEVCRFIIEGLITP